MGRCYYSHVSNRGNEIWGSWVCDRWMERRMISFCRKAFNGRFKDQWVYPEYFDDRYFYYTQSFFKEVGAILFPKITKIRREKGMTDEAWEYLVWETATKDYEKHMRYGTAPKFVIVKGIRRSSGEEKIISVELSDSLPEKEDVYLSEWM